MAIVNPTRAISIAVFSLCLSGVTYAADLPVLSVAEQADMDRALLKYMAGHPGNCITSGDFDCYVVLQGRIPTLQFLDAIGLPSGKLKPWSAADAAKADPKKNIIGSGHNVLRLNIGSFSMIAPGLAHATVREECGALCGSISTATMKKLNGSWTVMSLNVSSMQ